MITYIATALGSFLTVFVFQNSKLKEGFTDTVLGLMGRFSSKKIPLKNHKAFIILKSYKNQLNLFLFDNYTKSTFYKEFISIIFENTLILSEALIKALDDKTVNIEFLINEEFELCKERVDKDLNNRLVIPEKIANKLNHWKSLMLESLKTSVESLITDDVNNENYFKVYRTLDAILTFSNFLTSTGSIQFNNINGAFNEINVEDIYKKKEGVIEQVSTDLNVSLGKDIVS